MAFEVKNNFSPVFLIALVSAIVFIPFIGNCPLFDWDEVNFAECAREMLVSGNYRQVQLNYRPFWEKPPFFIWLQALSMHLFGVNEFAARFPNALCSVFSLSSLYFLGKQFHSARFGITWAFLYAASLLPHFYFKSGIIDPWFNFFIFLSVYHTFRFLYNPEGASERRNALYAGLFLGLAVLTKGPAAIVISALSTLAYCTWSRNFGALKRRNFFVFLVSTIVVAGSWFLAMWLSGHQELILEFIDYQFRLFKTGDAGHEGPFVYHFVALLVGCFPASLLFLKSYNAYAGLTPYQKNFRRMLLCLFWVVLLLFSIVKTKIVHYSSLCYYPIAFMGALAIAEPSEKRPGLLLKLLYWLIAGSLSLAFVLIGFTDQLKGWLIANNLIGDKTAVLNLQANGEWTGFEFLSGLLFFAACLIFYLGFTKNKLHLLYTGMALNIGCFTLIIATVVPKIELYTQHATIEFYRERAKEHCYVETHGFKSYAYLFYSARKPEDYKNPDQVRYINEILDLMESEGHSRFSSYSTANCFWIENGKIDRPGYIVTKTTDDQSTMFETGFKLLYEKNGFSFYRREPAAK